MISKMTGATPSIITKERDKTCASWRKIEDFFSPLMDLRLTESVIYVGVENQSRKCSWQLLHTILVHTLSSCTKFRQFGSISLIAQGAKMRHFSLVPKNKILPPTYPSLALRNFDLFFENVERLWQKRTSATSQPR